MGLEQVFVCSRTVRQLRDGPVGELLEGFCDWLLAGGFGRSTIRKHLAYTGHFQEYLRRVSPDVRQMVEARDVEGFFGDYPGWCRNRGLLETHVRQVGWSVSRLVEYLRESGRFAPEGQPSVYQPILDGYLGWMREFQHTAAGTLEIRSHSIRQFLNWLGPKATAEGLAALEPPRVEQYFVSFAAPMGGAARRSMQSALRTFFRYCRQQGYVSRPLDRAIPTLRTYKLSTVPRGLTEDQAQRVLESINRGGPVGRRDYAICQLLHTYGVRGAQVRGLQFGDIQWEQDRILIRAVKQGKDALLPLTSTVGESLLDYLQNARPSAPYPEIFLTARAPYRPFRDSNALSEVVRRRIAAAGITLHSRGAHAFRHGFATRMVARGHSLKELADVLGHRHLSTTFIYTKVDFKALEAVALPWPEAEQ